MNDFKWWIIAGGIFVLLIYVLYVDATNWEKFKSEHACRVVEKQSDSIGYSTNADGGVVLIPGKTAWLCDDGIKYWR